MRLLPLLASCLLASGAPTGKVATATVRVAVVGAGGYIGSRLHEHLERRGFAVTGYDRSTRLIASAGSLTFRAPVSAGQLFDKELHAFDVVIFLGGLTGRVACDTAQSAAKVHKENVEEPVNLAKRMRPHQLLIFASTSAIAEGSGDVPMRENGTVQTVLLDSYSASMYARERAMASLASGASSAAASLPQLVGLRFGTVIGVSRGQRTDLGPMALLRSAFTSGVLRVAHPETHRAFLWLEDLVEGFASLIQRARGVGTGATRYTRRFGIFNLLSFNSNVAALAAAVAARTGTRIDTLEHRPAKDSVGFTLDGAAFGQAFGFTPKGDLAAAVNDLVAHAPNSISAKGVVRSHTVPKYLPTYPHSPTARRPVSRPARSYPVPSHSRSCRRVSCAPPAASEGWRARRWAPPCQHLGGRAYAERRSRAHRRLDPVPRMRITQPAAHARPPTPASRQRLLQDDTGVPQLRAPPAAARALSHMQPPSSLAARKPQTPLL